MRYAARDGVGNTRRGEWSRGNSGLRRIERRSRGRQRRDRRSLQVRVSEAVQTDQDLLTAAGVDAVDLCEWLTCHDDGALEEDEVLLELSPEPPLVLPLEEVDVALALAPELEPELELVEVELEPDTLAPSPGLPEGLI